MPPAVIRILAAVCLAASLSACAPMSPAVKLAQAQLDAYNARDLERFVRQYHPDVEVFAVRGGQPLFRGMAAFRAQYAKRFASPGLHATLVGRLEMGRFVLDQERVTGITAGVVHAVAIYEIEGGLIRRVWFLRE